MRLFNVKSPASRLPAPAFQEHTLITLRAAEHVGNVPFLYCGTIIRYYKDRCVLLFAVPTKPELARVLLLMLLYSASLQKL